MGTLSIYVDLGRLYTAWKDSKDGRHKKTETIQTMRPMERRGEKNSQGNNYCKYIGHTPASTRATLE